MNQCVRWKSLISLPMLWSVADKNTGNTTEHEACFPLFWLRHYRPIPFQPFETSANPATATPSSSCCSPYRDECEHEHQWAAWTGHKVRDVADWAPVWKGKSCTLSRAAQNEQEAASRIGDGSAVARGTDQGWSDCWASVGSGASWCGSAWRNASEFTCWLWVFGIVSKYCQPLKEVDVARVQEQPQL